jgi:hypothetical protein
LAVIAVIPSITERIKAVLMGAPSGFAGCYCDYRDGAVGQRAVHPKTNLTRGLASL